MKVHSPYPSCVYNHKRFLSWASYRSSPTFNVLEEKATNRLTLFSTCPMAAPIAYWEAVVARIMGSFDSRCVSAGVSAKAFFRDLKLSTSDGLRSSSNIRHTLIKSFHSAKTFVINVSKSLVNGKMPGRRFLCSECSNSRLHQLSAREQIWPSHSQSFLDTRFYCSWIYTLKASNKCELAKFMQYSSEMLQVFSFVCSIKIISFRYTRRNISKYSWKKMFFWLMNDAGALVSPNVKTKNSKWPILYGRMF